MNKFYFLSSCSTCKRIIGELDLPSEVKLIDIKKTPLTIKELDALYLLTGSYEALFNRRARLIKEKKLDLATYSDGDYKNLLLDHYTFLKRPVFLIDDRVFIGNQKKTVEEAKKHLQNRK